MKGQEHSARQWDDEHPYIPLEMFRYMPDKDEEYYSGKGIDIKRHLFDGSALNQLTPFEKEQFQIFLDTFEKKKHKISPGT